MQRLGISGTTLYSLPSWLWTVNLFFNTKSNNIFFQKEAFSLPFVDHHYVGYTILVLNRPQNRCFTSYLLATDPYGKKTISRLRLFSQIWSMLLHNHPGMPTGQQDRLLALWRKAVRCRAGAQPQDDIQLQKEEIQRHITHFTHCHCIYNWSPPSDRRHQQSAAQRYSMQKLSFHEHHHGTRERLQRDFRPFQPVTLVGRVSFTYRAPLLWNMFFEEVQPQIPCLFSRERLYHSLTLQSQATTLCSSVLASLPAYFSSFPFLPSKL